MESLVAFLLLVLGLFFWAWYFAQTNEESFDRAMKRSGDFIPVNSLKAVLKSYAADHGRAVEQLTDAEKKDALWEHIKPIIEAKKK